MASQLIENHRNGAEIYHGEAVCKQKSIEILEELGLPDGLLPITTVELGLNPSTGFIWMKQNKKQEHKFEKIRKVVSFDNEITAFAERGRLRDITGVKSKELLIWVAVDSFFISDTSSDKVTFTTRAGLRRQFPGSAFVLEEEKK